jgi:hypothetical protein
MNIYWRLAAKAALLVLVIFLCWTLEPWTDADKASTGYLLGRSASEACKSTTCLSIKEKSSPVVSEQSGVSEADVDKSADKLKQKFENVIDEVRGGAWYKGLTKNTVNGQAYDPIVPVIALIIIGGIIAGVFTAVLSVKDLNVLLSNDFLLHFVGLVVIVLTVSMFGLIGTFEARDLTTILSAISGYILGQGANRKCGCAQAARQHAPASASGAGQDA